MNAHDLDEQRQRRADRAAEAVRASRQSDPWYRRDSVYLWYMLVGGVIAILVGFFS